jgi:hypothetical protein
MPWMRVSIGVGAGAVVAGVAGMILWIHDGSHFFDLAVAVAMAGFLTLISCVLTRVFGSSHGTQDDAFRRGRSMGYDAGFLEGHRTARPVVVPLHLVGRDPELPAHDYDSDSDHADEQDTPMPAAPMWRRDAREGVDWWDRWDRGSAWARGRRTPLLVGALALGVIGVLTASMLLPTAASTVTSRPLPGTLFNRDEPRSPATPALVAKLRARGAVSAVTGLSPLAPPAAAGGAAVPVAAAPAGTAVAAAGAPSSPNSAPGAGVAAPVTVYLPAVESPVTVPVVATPVVPLTAAEQTAADAKAAADLTAANAAAAAAETARVAAAAAEATRLQALADAYAVAHPAG